MIIAKAYVRKLFYQKASGEKKYLDGFGMWALVGYINAMGKNPEVEDVVLYAAAGDTKYEADKAVRNYLKATRFTGMITKFEYEDTEREIFAGDEVEGIDAGDGVNTGQDGGNIETLQAQSCLNCEHHRILNDADPHDWFCDDDKAIVCTITPNDQQDEKSAYKSDKQGFKCVTRSCRPYNLKKESSVPEWCPIPEMKVGISLGKAADNKS